MEYSVNLLNNLETVKDPDVKLGYDALYAFPRGWPIWIDDEGNKWALFCRPTPNHVSNKIEYTGKEIIGKLWIGYVTTEET